MSSVASAPTIAPCLGYMNARYRTLESSPTIEREEHVLLSTQPPSTQSVWFDLLNEIKIYSDLDVFFNRREISNEYLQQLAIIENDLDLPGSKQGTLLSNVFQFGLEVPGFLYSDYLHPIDINVIDSFGNAPLHYINVEVVTESYSKFLRDSTIIMNQRNLQGKTLFDLAVERGNDNLSLFLIEHGYYVSHYILPGFNKNYYSHDNLMIQLSTRGMRQTEEALIRRDRELRETIGAISENPLSKFEDSLYLCSVANALYQCVINNMTEEFIELFNVIIMNKNPFGFMTVDLADLFLNNRLDENYYFTDNDYLIVDIVYYNNNDLLRYVLMNGADPLVESKDFISPIYFSTDAEAIRIFIEHGRMDVNVNYPFYENLVPMFMRFLLVNNPEEFDDILAEIVNLGFHLETYFDLTHRQVNYDLIATDNLLNDINTIYHSSFDYGERSDDGEVPDAPSILPLLEYARRTGMMRTSGAITNYIIEYNQ